MPSGTPPILASRYMADSKEPEKRRAPVRNRFPTLAEVKSKVLDGRARFMISRLRRLKKERTSSFLAEVIPFHRGEVPSTMAYHSAWAVGEDMLERR